MLRDGANSGDVGEWNGAGGSEGGRGNGRVGWRDVDQALRRIARQRAALDADEARWLREAVRLEIWRPLGHASMREYLERVLGHGPQAAQERIRVATALGELPGCTRSLGAGELPYSAVRELTRVVTPATEHAWLDASRGKNLRQIEELVAGHAKGDSPEDPSNPELQTYVVRFEIGPVEYALLRQARQVLEDERGARLDDRQLIGALCGAVLSPPADGDHGRAKHQIAITTCEGCGRGTQQGAGVEVAVDAATVARAECDAQRIGRVDGRGADGAGDHVDGLPRATQDIPPRTRRFVWRRDRGRCCVPGCRAARNLELHHILARADGGGHAPENLVLLCGGHHGALHRGALVIRGRAPDRLEVKAAGARAELGGEATPRAHVHVPEGPRPHVETPLAARPHVGDRLRVSTLIVDAKQAIAQLGFTREEARVAVDQAVAAVGTEVDLALLLREALKRCPRPVG